MDLFEFDDNVWGKERLLQHDELKYFKRLYMITMNNNHEVNR